MLINPEATMIITSNASPGERGKEGKTKRAAWKSLPSSRNGRKVDSTQVQVRSTHTKFAKFS